MCKITIACIIAMVIVLGVVALLGLGLAKMIDDFCNFEK